MPSSPPPASGVLVVDKPKGPTSHDVVAVARRVLRTRRIGHSGTLDPMATGVLVLAVEEATKLVPWLTDDDKAYEATVRLGVETDSLDADGNIVAQSALSAELSEALAQLEGGAELPPGGVLARALAAERQRTEQVPPAYSAVRIAGERAHMLARSGRAPDLPPRPVAVRRLELVGGGRSPEPHLKISVEVAKGYFVRSLARDLAAALGTLGHLTELRRTRSGAFSLGDAASLDGLFQEAGSAPAARTEASLEVARARLLEALTPLEHAAARALPVSYLTDTGALHARDGKRIAKTELRSPHEAPSAWLDARGDLIAVGEASADGEGRVLRGFLPRRAP